MWPIEALSLRCDFCGAPPSGESFTSYPCATYERLTIAQGRTLLLVICTCCEPMPEFREDDQVSAYVALGAWIACPDCRTLVDAGDRAGLVARAVTRIGTGACAVGVRSAHEGYWRHRQPQN